MSANLPQFYVQQFASNVSMLLQQKGSRLSEAVTHGSYTGNAAQVVDQVGAIEMQPVSGRFEPMGRVDAALDSRWVYPSDFDLPQMIDSFDKLRLLCDPSSTYVQNAVAAAGRQKDRLILAAAIGTAKTGLQGANAVVLPAGQKIANNFGAASTTGLTVAKMREAKRLLMQAEVDLDADPLFMPISATQHDNLLAEAQVISLDYNDKPVMVEGKITRFLGINLIHTELVTAATIPVWAKSGMHLGIWNDITTDISQRKDVKGLPWQAYVYMTAGATRIEEKKIVQIACA